jgi:hypothetical protein
MGTNKFRSWLTDQTAAWHKWSQKRWEASKARYQSWSRKRVIISERMRLESRIAKLRRGRERRQPRPKKPSKLRFWIEGKKAAYRRWSRARVEASERGRIASQKARVRRKELRVQRRYTNKVYQERMADARADFLAARAVGRRGRFQSAAARSLPGWLALQATTLVWEQLCNELPDREPSSITFHEGLLKMNSRGR